MSERFGRKIDDSEIFLNLALLILTGDVACNSMPALSNILPSDAGTWVYL